MLYEFIATIAAAFGLAGVALIITHLMKLAGKKAPRWLIPSFAALGIFGFQIHQEYNWYGQQVEQLPAGVAVVKTIKERAWYRPWSYVKPQIVRFIAVDKGNASTQMDNQDIYLVNLYLFERRMSVQQVPQVIDCTVPARADYLIPDTDTQLDIRDYVEQTTAWRPLDKNDPLYETVCLEED